MGTVRANYSLTAIVVALAAGAAGPARAVDRVAPDLRSRYARLSDQAEAAARSGGPQAAIDAYEGALLGFAQGYGRVHLRLGQLYQTQGRKAEAAAHFRDCIADERVDALDRDIICKQGLAATTAPFEYVGLPEGGKVVVLRPNLFAGAVRSGAPLPLGEVEVMVETPGHEPRRSVLDLPRPRPWQVVVGLPVQGGPLVPDGFLAGDDGGFGGSAHGGSGFARTWPAWATAGLGVALVGTGVALGYSGASELDAIRADQRGGGCGRAFCAERLADAQNQATTADALWIAGAAVTAGAVALYLWLSD